MPFLGEKEFQSNFMNL